MGSGAMDAPQVMMMMGGRALTVMALITGRTVIMTFSRMQYMWLVDWTCCNPFPCFLKVSHVQFPQSVMADIQDEINSNIQ